MISGGGKPLLKGLVLAGGKSIRMGQDKGMSVWHGKPQRYYVADLLSAVCEEVFISCRPEQVDSIDKGYKTLPDQYEGAGPAGGILTAQENDPNAGWLVVACDLPFLDKETLQFLVENRNCDSIATTFESPFDHLPEPLITIWEPASYPILLAKLNEGFKCPRKILLNNPVTILNAPDSTALMNVNTPTDAETAKNIIYQKTKTC